MRPGPHQTLLNHYLPAYDYCERHSMVVRAPAEKLYGLIQDMDWSESAIVAALLRLRGFKLEQGFSPTMAGAQELGFIMLADDPPREVVFGLVGRFWTPLGNLRRMRPDEFIPFDSPGYAKAAGNFFIEQLSDCAVRISTETRIQCLGPRAKRFFRLYWLFIRPFSGLIRRLMLGLIRKKAVLP